MRPRNNRCVSCARPRPSRGGDHPHIVQVYASARKRKSRRSSWNHTERELRTFDAAERLSEGGGAHHVELLMRLDFPRKPASRSPRHQPANVSWGTGRPGSSRGLRRGAGHGRDPLLGRRNPGRQRHGTPDMSAEQITGGQHRPRTDVFWPGSSCNQSLTGEKPSTRSGA